MRLKYVEQADLDRIFEILSDKETSYLALTNGLYFTRSNLANFVWETPQGTISYPAVAIDCNNQVVGVAILNEIHPIHRSACFRILAVDGKSRSNGIGYKAGLKLIDIAFNELNLNKVYMYTWANNSNISMLTKWGVAKEEGYIRQCCFKDGQYVDKIIWGVLRDEYYDFKKRVK